MKNRILAAMSGGVDSSVAAAILARAGYEVIGATMLLQEDTSAHPQHIKDARAVADKLGIQHHVLDLKLLFRHCVVDNFVTEYSAGRTPNPCVRCNRWLKFGALLDEAKKLGCTHIATGHYARVTDGPSFWHLSKAANKAKDQSYFLYQLNQDTLPHVLFPLADFAGKDEIRRLAAEWALPVAEKTESQDICFIPGGDARAFLEKHNSALCRPGDIVLAATGQVIGRHTGAAFYTVGQRKGLGLSWPTPLFVVAIDATDNRLFVGAEDEIFKNRLTAKEITFTGAALTSGDSLPTKAKIRYAHAEAPAILHMTGPDSGEVTFEQPQRAITPGQTVVFYDGEYVLGGGIIEK